MIGLLGGIGAGKSTVARLLGSLGCGVIDADALAQAALDTPQVIDVLRQRWGPLIIRPDGKIDRSAVAKIVFKQPEELERLEDLLHPKVLIERKQMHERFQNDPEILAIVEDCPLLLEKGLDGGCNVLILVEASWEIRSKRVQVGRGWSSEELARREMNQIPIDTKAGRADYTVHNDAGEAACLDQARRVLSQIMQDAHRSPCIHNP